MINFNDVTKETIKEHNPNWPQIHDHPQRILIIGGSGSGNTNSLFNLINEEPDIDKTDLYAKDLYKAKYQFLIKKRESTSWKHFNESKAFIDYKILIVFDDIIADMLSNKKLNSVVTELFIRGRKLNIFLALTKFYALFLMKIPYKRELQQIAFNHPSDTDFKDFRNLENLLQNRILFQLLMVLLHQIMLYVLERIFQKEYNN